MRTIFTLPFLIAVAGLSAQPTIQQFLFVPGTVLVMDGEFPITSEGAAGANVTWDYSSLAFSTELFTYTAQTISTIDGADQFPGATAAYAVELIDDLTGHFFFDYTGGLADHGEIISGGGNDFVSAYSDPMILCATPASFGANGTDGYVFSTLITGMESTTTGSVTWSVDGYGTLKLPNATYTDVLRVHSMANETTVANISGTLITSESQEESWYWYKVGYPLPLLTYSVITDDFGSEPGSTVALISMTGPTGMNEERLPELIVQPNPTGGICTVSLPGAVDPLVRLLNSTGQVILEQSLKGGEPTLQVDFSDHASGAYFLEAHSVHGIQRTCIIHE